LTVWGASATHVLAGAADGTLWRYDGTLWSELASPTTAGIATLSGSAANDVFLLSEDGLLYYNDGIQWSRTRVRPYEKIKHVAASYSRVVVVGEDDTITQLDRFKPWNGCAASEVALCANGVDDDCDGYIDVGDDDCPQE
jgi:hypothetical protein